MAIVIQKFGGSSVADVEKLGVVADKIVAARKSGDDVVVVVSAMGKTTDELLSLAHQVDSDPPRRELDMLLTAGERITMSLLSMAVQKRGADAISFTGSQSGIITNDRHFDAKIIEVRPHRVEDELSRGRVVIIAGYQGMSYKREITTLGRGGSDTTALAMAAALGAERAEIYSDVDGVYSADPRRVANAVHLPSLSYEEMQAMAEHGAKVLHGPAVEFAKNAGIRIHARSTFAPGRETIVLSCPNRGGIRAIASRRGIAYGEISSDAAPSNPAQASEEIASILAGEAIERDAKRWLASRMLRARDFSRLTTDGTTRLGFTLNAVDNPGFGEVAIRDQGKAFLQAFPTGRWYESLCCISAIGELDEACLKRIDEVLENSDIERIARRKQPLSLSLIVPSDHADALEAALHALIE